MKETNLYRWYENKKSEVLGLLDSYLQLVNHLGFRTSKGDAMVITQLEDEETRLRSDMLSAMIIGVFNAGKSTFLNALNGEKILPTAATPATGVITELRYADEADKRVTLFPKPGQGPNNGDSPFTAKIENLKEELSKYIKLDHSFDDNDEGSDKYTSRYSKVVIEWPIELCRDNICLIDSVGLDDPEDRDAITLEYVKKIDVVLYCLSANHAYSAKDKSVLETLRQLHFNRILFIITHMNAIGNDIDDEDMDEEDPETYKLNMVKKLKPYTDLGEDGIIFVDSRSALAAYKEVDNELREKRLTASGIPYAKKRLENFLVTERGRAKLHLSLANITAAGKDICSRMSARIAATKQSELEFREKYDRAKQRLNLKSKELQTIIQELRLALKRAQRNTLSMTEAYVAESPSRLEKASRGWTLPNLSVLAGKKEREEVVMKITNQAKDFIESDLRKWVSEVMYPSFSNSVNMEKRSVKSSIESYLAGLDKIQSELIGSPSSSIGSSNMTLSSNTLNVDISAEQYMSLASGSLLIGGGLALIIGVSIAVISAPLTALLAVPPMAFVALCKGGGAVFKGMEEGSKKIAQWASKNILNKVLEAYTKQLRSPEFQDQISEKVSSVLAAEIEKIVSNTEDGLTRALESVKSNAEQSYSVLKQGEAVAKAVQEQYEKALRQVTLLNNKISFLQGELDSPPL